MTSTQPDICPLSSSPLSDEWQVMDEDLPDTVAELPDMATCPPIIPVAAVCGPILAGDDTVLARGETSVPMETAGAQSSLPPPPPPPSPSRQHRLSEDSDLFHSNAFFASPAEASDPDGQPANPSYGEEAYNASLPAPHSSLAVPVPLTAETQRKLRREYRPEEVLRDPVPIYLPVERELCWRCGFSGHSRAECDQPSRLFCSRFGLYGIMSRDCPCGPPLPSRAVRPPARPEPVVEPQLRLVTAWPVSRSQGSQTSIRIVADQATQTDGCSCSCRCARRQPVAPPVRRRSSARNSRW